MSDDVQFTVEVKVLTRFAAESRKCSHPEGCAKPRGAQFVVNDQAYCAQHLAAAIRAGAYHR